MEAARAPQVSMDEKIASVWNLLSSYHLTPKSFLTAFLDYTGINAAFRWHFWGLVEWPSTERLLSSIKALVCRTAKGKGNWEDFILNQVNFLSTSTFLVLWKSMYLVSCLFRQSKLFVWRGLVAETTPMVNMSTQTRSTCNFSPIEKDWHEKNLWRKKCLSCIN
jgi:hypothetical protein